MYERQVYIISKFSSNSIVLCTKRSGLGSCAIAFSFIYSQVTKFAFLLLRFLSMVTAYLSFSNNIELCIFVFCFVFQQGHSWFDNISISSPYSDPIVFTFPMRKATGEIVRWSWFVYGWLFAGSKNRHGSGSQPLHSFLFITLKQWKFLTSKTKNVHLSSVFLGIILNRFHLWIVVFQRLISSNYILLILFWITIVASRFNVFVFSYCFKNESNSCPLYQEQ